MTPPAINRPPETAAKHLDMDTSVSEMRGVQERMLKQHTPLSNSQLVTKDSPLPPASRPQPAHPPIFLPPTNDPTSKPKTSDPTMVGPTIGQILLFLHVLTAVAERIHVRRVDGKNARQELGSLDRFVDPKFL